MTDRRQGPDRKRRRDYEDTSAAILEATGAAFAEKGTGLSIREIADRAGVAPATLYRHFPSREALLQAVFEDRVSIYASAIESAQAIEDPAEAFRATIRSIVELQAHDRSFREIVGAREASPLDDEVLMRFGSALLEALAGARAAKVLRADVTDEDIMLLLAATERIARPVGGESAAALERFVELALDGLCAERRTPTAAPLTHEQLLNVVSD